MKSLSAIWKKVFGSYATTPDSEMDNETMQLERRAYRSTSSERESWQHNPAPRHHAPAGADSRAAAQRQLCSSPLKDQNSIFY